MKSTFIAHIVLVVSQLLIYPHVNAEEPIQNRMTWYNKSWSVPDEGKWILHISELPDNSKCNIGSRKFDPSMAVDKSLAWVRENGYDYETLLIQDVVIHKMGMGWQDCVYIISVFNEDPWINLEIGVSLDGKKMFLPERQ